MGAFSKNIAEMWLVLSPTVIWTGRVGGSGAREEGSVKWGKDEYRPTCCVYHQFPSYSPPV
jgi:hypothetical protein